MKYKQYVAKRLLFFFPMLVAISFILWYVLHEVFVGDPLAAYVSEGTIFWNTEDRLAELRIHYGLDKPWLERYFNYMNLLFQGDFGLTGRGEPILPKILGSIPITFQLIITSVIIAILLGVPLGIRASTSKNQTTQSFIKSTTLVGYSIPSFLIALSIKFIWYLTFFSLASTLKDYTLAKLTLFEGQYNIYLFPEETLPSYILFGFAKPTGILILDSLLSFNFLLFLDVSLHIIIPSLVIVLGIIPFIIHMTSLTMKQALSEDYILLAKSKGLSDKKIYYKHAFRNAALPLLSTVGILIGELLIGTVIVEQIFQIEGLGSFLVYSVAVFDTAAVSGILVFITLFILVLNLIIDLLYGYIDPRIRT